MPDFPTGAMPRPFGALGSLDASNALPGELCVIAGVTSSAGAWSSANLAIYCPVLVERRVTIYQMLVDIGTSSGNLDLGVYDEAGNRLVSLGSTASPGTGAQAFNIADTVLDAGLYYLALSADNTTITFQRAAVVAGIGRACGVRQQALGSVVLPATATFADLSFANIPKVMASTVATI